MASICLDFPDMSDAVPGRHSLKAALHDSPAAEQRSADHQHDATRPNTLRPHTNHPLLLQETSESEAAAGGSDTPHNGPSMPPGLGPAVAAAAAAAAAGGVGAHTFLQQTMSQLLRPSSARPDLVPSPPSHLGHGSETPRPPYWGAPHDLRPDADRQDTHSPPTSDPTKVQ